MKKQIIILERKKYNKIIDSDIYIIDFDHTLTTMDSSTSIGVFSNILDIKYKIKKEKIDKKLLKTKILYKYYWFKKIKLLKKYISKDDINSAINYFKPNLYLINKLKGKNIIICSSGYEELISLLLNMYNFSYDLLIANKLNTSYFNIVTPKNKYKFVDKYIKKNNMEHKKIVLIGDDDNDIKMSLLDYNKFYKIV